MMNRVAVQDHRGVLRDKYTMIDEIFCRVVRGGHPEWRVNALNLMMRGTMSDLQ